ncbi:MAG: cache domain-containing protein [Spirochaetia bacterium]|jgi:methyl-accepting chemotaxis protein|nr:cache domain-containing protein [Spirochaetia bacterium]
MKGRSWGISQKFIVFVASAIAIFLLAAFLITRTMLEEHALRSAKETASIILDQTDKRLVSFFSEQKALAQSLAATKAVQASDPSGMRDLFLTSVQARQDYLRAIYLGTSDGRMLEWGIGKEFIDNMPSFPPGYDPRVRPWYIRAMELGDFSISAPYRYASVDDIGITCAMPVLTPDGSLVGVLGMDILLESLASVLDGLAIPRGGKAVILGSSGEIIASQFEEDRPEGMILKRFAAGDVLGARTGDFTGSIAGFETQFVYQRSQVLGWIAVVAMPLGPIRESVTTLLRLIGYVELILMAALVVALAGISGKLIVTPLGHIISVINKIEGGQKGLRVSVDSSDEFGFLGDEFNHLLDVVEEYSSNLEEKVRVRTDELVRLQRENTRLRIIEERRRIYRDMHDAIGAKLTNIFFSNGVARDLAKDGPERLQGMLSAVEDNCLQAVASLKGIILGMHEDDRRANSFSLGISAGLRSRLEAKGIALDCIIRNKRAIEELPKTLLDELEMILDEMVSNVLKHSQARSVRLRLSRQSGGVSLRFSDDGQGFDPGSKRLGSGIGNVRYRVESLGGSIRLETSIGKGTLYRVTIPYTMVAEVES